MFGLVPKPLWNRICPADPENRILQRANLLLVDHPEAGWGLVDTGCGAPETYTPKERELSGLSSDWGLATALHGRNLSFADIAWVILTHAHWDHAGGLLLPDGSPAFPNAKIYLFETEYDLATSGDPLLYKSYPAPVSNALRQLESSIIKVREPGTELFPGIRLESAAGHTAGQACILFAPLEFRGREIQELPGLLFTGDNCPTRHHLRLVFQTAYDTLPLQTRAWKRSWFPRCARENIPLFFTHDAETSGARIQADPKHEFLVTSLLLP